MKIIGVAMIGLLCAICFPAASMAVGAGPARTEPAKIELPSQPVLMSAWPDTFSSYVWTFGNIILFSYEDSTEVVLKDSAGAVVWDGALNADARKVIITQPGTFFIQGNKRYSVLTGDATFAGCRIRDRHGWNFRRRFQICPALVQPRVERNRRANAGSPSDI